jgi:hypothetical protein
MEYLKIAQDLDMYGVNYFFIRVSQGPSLTHQAKPICHFEHEIIAVPCSTLHYILNHY